MVREDGRGGSPLLSINAHAADVTPASRAKVVSAAASIVRQPRGKLLLGRVSEKLGQQPLGQCCMKRTRRPGRVSTQAAMTEINGQWQQTDRHIKGQVHITARALGLERLGFTGVCHDEAGWSKRSMFEEKTGKRST